MKPKIHKNMAAKPTKKKGRVTNLPATKIKAGFSANGCAWATGCPNTIGEILNEVFLYSNQPVAVGWRKHTGQEKKGDTVC